MVGDRNWDVFGINLSEIKSKPTPLPVEKEREETIFQIQALPNGRLSPAGYQACEVQFVAGTLLLVEWHIARQTRTKWVTENEAGWR